MTAANSVTPAVCRQRAMVSGSGEIRVSAQRRRLGRLKKPSIISEVSPSSNSSVDTPSHVARSPRRPSDAAGCRQSR